MLSFPRLALQKCARSLSTAVEKKNERLIKELGKERSLNQVQLIGRVGQDPKIGGMNDVDDGKKERKVVMFSLATNEFSGTSEKGEIKTRVDWHRIAIFNTRVQENVEKYVRQGDRIHVTGKLHYNLVKDNNNNQRYISSIVADDIIFLSKYL